MRVYHITRRSNAASILKHGLRDGRGTYMTRNEHSGVWVSDEPLWIESGIDPDDAVCFEITIDEGTLAPYEWIEDGKGYREWLVPAATLKAHGKMRSLTDDEVTLSL